MNLLYITFGQQANYHLQSTFSMLTFLRVPQLVQSITIMTDAPMFYQALAAHVNIIPISESRLRDWRGPHDFFWRIKIKAIEQLIADKPDQDILYLDSDTFLFANHQNLTEAFQQHKTLMWENEGLLAKGTKSHKALYQQLSGKTFAGIPVTDYPMWNAGVVGLPSKLAKNIIDLALQLCDDMCASGAPFRFIEQFALSVATQVHHPLTATKPIIAHYYTNKDQWENIISLFLASHWMQHHDLEQILLALNQFSFTQAPTLTLKKNTRVKLVNVLETLMPDKKIEYCQSMD